MLCYNFKKFTLRGLMFKIFMNPLKFYWVSAFATVLLLVSNLSQAAIVKKISKKKRLIWIDSGKKDGIKKKQKICFFNQKGKKRACGKVVKVKNKTSIVKISKKNIKKVKKGYSTTKDPSTAEADSGTSALSDIRLSLGAVSALIPASTADTIYYNPKTNEKPVSLWELEKAGSLLNILNFQFNLEAYFSSLNIAVGTNLRFWEMHFSSQIDLPVNTIAYSSLSSSASFLELYADYFFLNTGSISIGAGLGFALESFSFIANKDEQPLHTLSGSAIIISLRVPILYTMPLGGLDLSIGTILGVPYAMTSMSPIESVSDPNLTKAIKIDKDYAYEAQLTELINYRRNLFSASFILQAGMRF
jgi:hypothetical protein